VGSVILCILGWRKKRRILERLKPDSSVKLKFPRILMLVTGLGLIFFSLLGPQAFEGFTEIERTGLDIYFLIDTSTSMLVEDIQPNRITRAKKNIESIINNLAGDRVGFIPYSSSAYVQMPLTDDYDLARMFLNVIDTDMIGGGGTNVGNAIKLANDSFDRVSGSDRVIIIISDGEEYDTNSQSVLDSINDSKLKVYAIGVGTEKGGLIPVYDSTGERRIDYKKDSNGDFVMSRMDPVMLQKLASSGNGAYFQSSVSGDEIKSLISQLALLKRETFQTEKVRRFKQLYQYFLGAGLLLFLAAYLLPDWRSAE